MTAMCDVAFLILIFFVLATRPVIRSPIKINEPVSTKFPGCVLLEGNKATILIGNGKEMINLPDEETRARTLVQMGALYHINFSAAEIQNFSKIEVIGVPMSGLKKFLHNSGGASFFNQPGIPERQNDHELGDWIDQSRQVYRTLYDKSLEFTIDGDKTLKYPQIKDVVSVLNSKQVFKLSLVTHIISRKKPTK